MNIILVVIFGLVGIGLLLAELFLLPGFGLAGICGFLCLVAAVVVAYLWISPMAGTITLIACGVVSIAAIIGFFKSDALDKMALDTTIDSKVDLADPGKRLEELEKEKH